MSLVKSILIEHIQKQLGLQVTGYTTIGHGAHNQNYLLDTCKGKLMLRIYANTQFENAEQEHRILTLLDGFLGPRSYYLDTTRTRIEYDYMVLDYIEGTVIREFTDQALIEIAGKLKKLHAIHYPRSNPSLISDWTRKNITEKSLKLGDRTHSQVMSLWNKLNSLQSEIQPLLKDYSPDSLLHDDPILGNFIQTSEDIKLIDWELAHGNYFFMDLGGFIQENRLTPHKEQVFLEAYGFAFDPDEKKILDFAKAYRVLAIVGWYIERIVALDSGEPVFIDADLDEYRVNLNREMENLDSLLS